VVIHSPRKPTARVQLPVALSSLTPAIIPSGSVKCVAISKQWVTAVEDCEYTVTFLRMTLRIGHWGFQPAHVKIVTLIYIKCAKTYIWISSKISRGSSGSCISYRRSILFRELAIFSSKTRPTAPRSRLAAWFDWFNWHSKTSITRKITMLVSLLGYDHCYNHVEVVSQKAHQF